MSVSGDDIASYDGTSSGSHDDARPSVPDNVIVLEGTSSLSVDIDAVLLAVMDPIATHDRVGFVSDLDPGKGVPVNVIILERAARLLRDQDATLIIVDAGPPDDGFRAFSRLKSG